MSGRDKNARKAAAAKSRGSSMALSSNRPDDIQHARKSSKKSASSQKKRSEQRKGQEEGRGAANVVTAPDNDDDSDDDEADNSSDADSDDYSSVSVDELPPIRAYGHTYHGSGQVLTPNDESERERQALQHELFKLSLDGALTATKLPRDRPLRVLDVGCGSGVWALELGEQLPLAHVMGVDLSAALLPTAVPRNVVFEVEDAGEPWGRPRDSLDFVHLRNLMGGGVRDWRHLAEQALQTLRPGGLIEFSEVRTRFYDLDRRDDGEEGSSGEEKTAEEAAEDGDKPGAACREFEKLFARTAEQIGIDVDPVGKIPLILSGLGFEKVVETTDLFPIRPWGNDEKNRTKGALAQRYCELGFENYSMSVFGRAGIPEADTRALLARVQADMMDPRLQGFGQMVFITARKPFEDSNSD